MICFFFSRHVIIFYRLLPLIPSISFFSQCFSICCALYTSSLNHIISPVLICSHALSEALNHSRCMDFLLRLLAKERIFITPLCIIKFNPSSDCHPHTAVTTGLMSLLPVLVLPMSVRMLTGFEGQGVLLWQQRDLVKRPVMKERGGVVEYTREMCLWTL